VTGKSVTAVGLPALTGADERAPAAGSPEGPVKPLERRSRPRFDPADALGRLTIIVLFSLLAYRLAVDFHATGRVTGLLLLLSELLVVALTVVRRSAVRIDRSWKARFLTGLSAAGPLLFRPVSANGLVADAFTATITTVGLLVSLAGKLSLGRSFGLMPANRGIVCAGLYRFVRHPIYTGYLITHVAFLVAHPSLWNAAIILVADTALLTRAVREERTLRSDPEYSRYLGNVRWRVCPGLF
jgi:hypothetical protein